MPASQNGIFQNSVISRKHRLISSFIKTIWQSESFRKLLEFSIFRVNLRRRWNVDSVRVILNFQKWRSGKSQRRRVELRKTVYISGLDSSGQLVELLRHDFAVLVDESDSRSRDEHARDASEDGIVAHIPVDAVVAERAAAASRAASIRRLNKSMRDELIRAQKYNHIFNPNPVLSGADI